MYLYFLTVAGILLFVFSSVYPLSQLLYYPTPEWGETCLLRQQLYLEAFKPCSWTQHESVCGLVFMSSACWWWPFLVLIFELHLKIVLSFWPPGPIKVFWLSILRDCQCWLLGQWLTLDAQTALIFVSLLSGFDERLFTLPYGVGKKRNALNGVSLEDCSKNYDSFLTCFLAWSFNLLLSWITVQIYSHTTPVTLNI